MASSKDTFEPRTFRAHTFAAGAWRGVGVTVAVVVGPYRIEASQGYLPGSTAFGTYHPGAQVSQSYLPGGVAFDIYHPGPQVGQSHIPGSQEGDAF